MRTYRYPGNSPRTRSARWILLFSLSAFLLLGLYSCGNIARADEENEAPVIERESVNPGSGSVRDEFLFTAQYTDPDNDAPTYVRVVIDDKRHTMKPAVAEDENYTDGRMYYFSQKFSNPEPIIYYFEASDGTENTTSRIRTLYVDDEFEWHIDIAIVFGLYLIPVIWIGHIAHKMSRSLGKMETVLGRFADEYCSTLDTPPDGHTKNSGQETAQQRGTKFRGAVEHEVLDKRKESGPPFSGPPKGT